VPSPAGVVVGFDLDRTGPPIRRRRSAALSTPGGRAYRPSRTPGPLPHRGSGTARGGVATRAAAAWVASRGRTSGRPTVAYPARSGRGGRPPPADGRLSIEIEPTTTRWRHKAPLSGRRGGEGSALPAALPAAMTATQTLGGTLVAAGRPRPRLDPTARRRGESGNGGGIESCEEHSHGAVCRAGCPDRRAGMLDPGAERPGPSG